VSPLLLLFCSLLYVALLFAIARFGDQRKFTNLPPALLYSLTIAIYCTSWTFFGAVGTAANDGWMFLPIYLGPILLFVFGYPILYKILVVCKEQNISSIADFITTRYGKSIGLSNLINVLLILAIVPYIALQLKAISFGFDTLASTSSNTRTLDTALFSAVAMALLAIVFGTKTVEATKPRPGLMTTIAFESIFKLAVLIILAILCVSWLADDTFSNWPTILAKQFNSQQFAWQTGRSSFITTTFLAAGAILCLPRQFHVTFVENTVPAYLKSARWIMPLYLILISLVVIPITVVGGSLFSDVSSIPADTYVLSIPASQNLTVLSILMFLGGFAASTGMIIVSTLALSTMITNNTIMPYIVRSRKNTHNESYRASVLYWRRVTISLILLAAYLYKVIIGDYFPLAATGLIAFSLVAQFIPAIIASVYFDKSTYRGIITGLLLGTSCWLYFIMLPALASAGMIDQEFVSSGLLGYSYLAPENFLNLNISSFDTGVWLSVIFNLAAITLLSGEDKQSFTERSQANAFVNPLQLVQEQKYKRSLKSITNQDIISLLERFLGHTEVNQLLQDYVASFDEPVIPSNNPSESFLSFSEKRLSGAIGSATASTVIETIIRGDSVSAESLVNLFDETSQQIKFNQKLLQATLENMAQGISVVDRDLNLVAWNQRYLDMFQYPDNFIQAGMPIEDVVNFNVKRGMLNKESNNFDNDESLIDKEVKKRLAHLRRGTSYVYEREWLDNRVIEINGNPMPGGGFVTSYSDITAYKEVQKKLKESADKLEHRVAQRTQEISSINHELKQEVELRKFSEQAMDKAKREAELANKTKTKFIALASHDILQPLTAARLYASALESNSIELDNNRNVEIEQKSIIEKIKLSLKSTEELVATLLEIARFDQGAFKPDLQAISLPELIDSLINEFSVLAEEKDMLIRKSACQFIIKSDKQWLRRILQNYISNAIKYSDGKKMLVGCKRRGDHIRVVVGDCGPGLSEHDQSAIFNEFYRLPSNSSNESGAGLGLSVVLRMSEALGHHAGIISAPGRSSLFYVDVPITSDTVVGKEQIRLPNEVNDSKKLVWYFDDDEQQLDAMKVLLNKWGFSLVIFSNVDEIQRAAEHAKPDILLMDYDLSSTLNGIELYEKLQISWQGQVEAILLTANQDQDIQQRAKDVSMIYLKKPAKPAALRALLN
jgi:Na+/proline symporter/signal transduction histidine kinase/CheY-like chemotaxis protein